MKKTTSATATGLILGVLAIGAGLFWWWQQQTAIPAGIAYGNGRIEADAIEVSTKYAGRVAEVFVDEGDMVKTGQILARMETEELTARIREIEAEVLRARASQRTMAALIAKRESERALAERQLKRSEALFRSKVISEDQLDHHRTALATAVASVDEAQGQRDQAEASFAAATARLERFRAELADSELKATRDGRVEYRLAEPGEVLGPGGMVLTVLDLTDVSMTIFLPAAEAGRLAIGAEARVVLDARPDMAIPAQVSFVSSEAQFTPKQVETRSEREKLMFRVKVKLPSYLLERYIKRVKTGLTGMGYVRIADDALWPEALESDLTREIGPPG